MKGMTGATLTPTGIPASASVRIVRKRLDGVAARGSSLRASPASSVVTVTAATVRCFAAIGASRSMSRSIKVDLVINPTG